MPTVCDEDDSTIPPPTLHSGEVEWMTEQQQISGGTKNFHPVFISIQFDGFVWKSPSRKRFSREQKYNNSKCVGVDKIANDVIGLTSWMWNSVRDNHQQVLVLVCLCVRVEQVERAHTRGIWHPLDQPVS